MTDLEKAEAVVLGLADALLVCNCGHAIPSGLAGEGFGFARCTVCKQVWRNDYISALPSQMAQWQNIWRRGSMFEEEGYELVMDDNGSFSRGPQLRLHRRAKA